MRKGWMSVTVVAWLVGGLAGCNAAERACEDFIDAVEECQGAPDDHYNQAWCDEGVDRGCEDREYYDCLRDNLECVDGEASTHPIFCQIAADVVCPN